MARDFEVVFLADATATTDYGDVGHGRLTADEVQRSTLMVLAESTADVMTADELPSRLGARPPAG